MFPRVDCRMATHKEYDAWHRHQAANERSSGDLYHPWHVTVARLLPDIQGQRILEISCGRGDFAIWLARKYPQAEVNAIELSEAAINIARVKSPQGGCLRAFCGWKC